MGSESMAPHRFGFSMVGRPVDFSNTLFDSPSLVGSGAIVSSFGCRDWVGDVSDVRWVCLGTRGVLDGHSTAYKILHWVLDFTGSSCSTITVDGCYGMICWMVIVVQGMKIQYGVLDAQSLHWNGPASWNASYGHATNQNITCFESNDRDECTRRYPIASNTIAS